MIHNNLSKLVIRFRENKLSHAFLVETNNVELCVLEIKEVIKQIVCPTEFTNSCEQSCNLCNLIDKNTLPSINFVEPAGTVIKKEQILELKEKLLSKPLYTDFNFYCIINAEKLNSFSANTMLKFIEEPESGIIGFFITNNIENIITTIRSRCQLVSVFYEASDEYSEFAITENDFNNYLNLINEYLLLSNDLDMMMLKNKDLVLENLKTRAEIEIFYKIMLKIFKIKVDEHILKVDKLNFEQFNFINNNNMQVNIKIMKIIEKQIDKIQYNPNLELLLDSFVIEMRKVHG